MEEPDNWAEMIELRIGAPRYTPDNRKLYPLYMFREGEPRKEKDLTPDQARSIGATLRQCFDRF